MIEQKLMTRAKTNKLSINRDFFSPWKLWGGKFWYSLNVRLKLSNSLDTVFYFPREALGVTLRADWELILSDSARHREAQLQPKNKNCRYLFLVCSLTSHQLLWCGFFVVDNFPYEKEQKWMLKFPLSHHKGICWHLNWISIVLRPTMSHNNQRTSW